MRLRARDRHAPRPRWRPADSQSGECRCYASSQLDDSIPAIMPVIRDGKRVDIKFRGASYGYGLFIYAPRWACRPQRLARLAILFWACPSWWDIHLGGPRTELVAVYLSVSPRLNRDIGVMNSDLFQNAVYGAIVDQ
jgi:hypothetical protein